MLRKYTRAFFNFFKKVYYAICPPTTKRFHGSYTDAHALRPPSIRPLHPTSPTPNPAPLRPTQQHRCCLPIHILSLPFLCFLPSLPSLPFLPFTRLRVATQPARQPRRETTALR